ncbi:MAG: HD domain-containing protein [Nitrospiraceae bacterium]|nr:HD domain-containing protein [Nitrospiraceae bacterium]
MFELLLLAGILAAAWGLWKTLSRPQDSGGGLPSSGDKKEIALEALSSIWARHKNTEIFLGQLAGIWREQGQPQTGPAEFADPVFQHPEIQEFYGRHVKDRHFSAAAAGDVIREILGLLDQEGDCPSVVNEKLNEGSLEKNAYDLLAQIPLYRHSLDVAEELIKAFKESPAAIPKVLIASLGHDLGKLPSYRKTLYTMGDHPLMSVTVLESLQGYGGLSYREEINRAISSHHRNPQGLLEEKLKEADMAARRLELARNVREHVESTSALAGPERPGEPTPPARTAGAPGLAERVQAGQIQNGCVTNGFISYAPEKKEVVAMKEVPILWFDAERFLAELKPYINRLDGDRWSAFSMPDGHVYFQTGVIEEIAKKLGKGNPDIALMDADKELKRNILYSVVCSLRREKEAIARGLIKDAYFGGPFIIRMLGGREISSYYTPFKAEAFGETVSYFEELKTGKIKEIEEMRPKIQK